VSRQVQYGPRASGGEFFGFSWVGGMHTFGTGRVGGSGAHVMRGALPLLSGFQFLAVAGVRFSLVVLYLTRGSDFGENVTMASPDPRSRLAAGGVQGEFSSMWRVRCSRSISRGRSPRSLVAARRAKGGGSGSSLRVSFAHLFPFLVLHVSGFCSARSKFLSGLLRHGPRPLCR